MTPRSCQRPEPSWVSRLPSRFARQGFTRQGFTLVEILVVIGIILILIGIAVVGFNQLDRVVSAKSTKTTLQNLQGMVDEFAAINGTGLLEEYWTTSMTSVPQPVYTDSSTTTPVSVPSPVDVTPSGADRFGTVVTNTGRIMAQLQRIPANKQAMQQMPTKQILAPPSGQPPLITPQLTDAWRDPIIFVPAGGLTGVTLNNGTLTNQTVKAPDGRPFWASAGPDGDFTKGDDNVYSFQN